MNKNRRKKIENVVEKLKECSDNLSYIKDEEDESRDNVPEGLQSGEIYSYSEECSEKMDNAISEIDSIISDLEEI